MTKVSDRSIWYFSETGEWWMEPDDRLAVFAMLSSRIDGIRVTNAYQVLAPEFIAHLRAESSLKPR